jgi:subtilisin family serine protease
LQTQGDTSRTKLKALAVAMALATTAYASTTHANGPDPDRVWVKFRPGAAGQVENALRAANGCIHHRFDDLGAFAVSVPPQALNGLINNPNIEYIEPDAVRYPMAQVTPYGVPRVQAPQAISVGADGTGVKVCVIDSGIKADYEDFAGIAMTGSASSGQSWNTDSCGHGSHVAGTIAAANNGLGVIGVSPGKVSLHIVRVFDGATCAWSYSSSLVAAAQNCQAAGAKVINMSLGGSTSSTTENTAAPTKPRSPTDRSQPVVAAEARAGSRAGLARFWPGTGGSLGGAPMARGAAQAWQRLHQ